MAITVPNSPLAPQATLLAAESEAQIDAVSHPQPAFVPSASDLLYVAQDTSISVFRQNASGNTPPLYTISGPKTQIDDARSLAEDAQGNLYVANSYEGTHPAILVFAHGAHGNIAPIRVIAGPLTGLNPGIESMTVDQTTGKIYAMVTEGQSGYYTYAASLLRFAPDSNGNVAPYAASAPTLSPAYGIISDSTGKNIIAGGFKFDSVNGVFDSIYTVAKQFPNGENLPIIRQISNFGIGGRLAADPATKTFLDAEAPLYRLSETTTGHGNPYAAPTLIPAAEAAIYIPTTYIAVGYERNIFVTLPTEIDVYAHYADGHNVKPIRVLSGPATGIAGPSAIYEGQ